MIKKKLKKKKTTNDLESQDKPSKKNKGGRKKLIDKELSDQQKILAELLGRKIEPKIASDIAGVSRYQLNSWIDLPKMKQEIERWEYMYAKMGVERVAMLVEELQSDIVLELRMRIKGSTESMLSENALMKLFDKTLVMTGIMTPLSEDSMTITEKRIKRAGPALLPSSTSKPRLTFDDDDDTIDVESQTETEERSIEQTKRRDMSRAETNKTEEDD